MDIIDELEKEVKNLRDQLVKKEEELNQLKSSAAEPNNDKLSNDDIARYSRQIILPQIGVSGQIKLKQAKILVIGAGGLGCPALLYLACSGVANLGIVDDDIVEKNNLHRQILHTENSLGTSKIKSAKDAILRINSKCNVKTHYLQLNSDETFRIIEPYDVVLDCSDNVATRYLVNDTCVLTGKPLVSGSALQFEGQLTVYNYNNGPCYRCLFPTPPPPETISNCGDVGVLGAITGVIGSLQALEAIKIILGLEGVLSGRLLLFDGTRTSFRNVKLRQKRENCDVCSENPIITNLIHYEQFCEMRASDKHIYLQLIPAKDRLRPAEYKKIVDEGLQHLLIDVRKPNEFEICKLDNSINVPLKDILDDTRLDEIKTKIKDKDIPIILVCRRGNDSQIAVNHMKLKLSSCVEDIIGGLHAWHNEIDDSFPIY